MTMLVFAGVGVHAALDIASAVYYDGFVPATGDEPATYLPDAYLPFEYIFTGGQPYNVSTFQETALGFVFFTWFTVFPIIGLLVGVAGRGVLSPAGDKGWFSFSTVEGGWNRQALPLQIALLIWAAAHMATIWHFDQGSRLQTVFVLVVLVDIQANGFVGYYSALLTGNCRHYRFWHGRRAMVYTSNDALIVVVVVPRWFLV